MTPLPQRKKTAEEIVQLRDQLGVPAVVEDQEPERQEPERVATTSAAKPSSPPAQQATVSPQSGLWLPPPSYPEAMRLKSPAPQADQRKLPIKRRSNEELEEMRRREMLSKINGPAPTNIKFMAAHPALIAGGYLLAAVGLCGFWIKTYPWIAIIIGSVLALAVAGFMALRRPVSRHHAGFISMISVLVGVFSTIQHFPQLQHAS